MNFKKNRPYFITAGIIFLVMLSGAFSGESPETVRSIICGSLIAIAVVITIPIYDINAWSLTKRSAVHFLIMLMTVLPLVLLSGWYDWMTPLGFLGTIGVFLLSGLVLWTVGYSINSLSDKRETKNKR